MPDEGFLRRWARLKADGPAAAEAAVAPAPAPAPAEPRAVAPHPARAAADPAPVLPTLDDVARLDASSDFSTFVSQGVDKDVRRLAMKKLFSDPHFNLVDKLDVYMDDYNKPSPMSAGMLAALHHTKNLFAPLAADKQEGEDAAGEGLATDTPASPNPVVPGIAGADSPAQAETQAEAPESHSVSLAPGSDVLGMDSRLRGNDDSAFNANSAIQFDFTQQGKA